MTTPERTSPELDDPRVVAALEEYLAAIESGRPPDRHGFLARHAEIAATLEECLEGLEALNDVDPISPTTEIAATPLGDFRLLREIGRGGMGVVYEAEQLSLGRRVALKVLPFAAALDARQLQRFKNEAQAAAHLHHPHIVPVYGVGCERGVHYYAMQLIHGQNLAALVADLRTHRVPHSPAPPSIETLGEPGARLSTLRSDRPADFFRTIARLIVQAAEALDYAHGVGVVHRDVKPANLLVDASGNVWVTDFGLAQFSADAGLTQTGDLLGTLRYMSPEQAGGRRVEIDHRTDVYSLGATLYELLTLRPIFDGPDRQTLLRQIMTEEPRPPRSVDATIPAELETIVLKAVAKSPPERYATARELADDLQRYLRHEPIRARRASLFQRARKWLKRHPSVPIAGGLLLTLMAIGSLFSAWLVLTEKEKTQRAYDAERLRAAEALRQAERAEQGFRVARETVDLMIRVSEEDLSDHPGMQAARKRLLEAALIYYQEFIEQRRDDPDARAELAATHGRVQTILADLAVIQGAGQIFLLGEPAVLDDLGLTPEQRERIGGVMGRLDRQRGELFRDFQKLTAEERRQRFLESARANDAAVNAVLSPPQLQRLRQISLQVQGLFALNDSTVSATLKLTADQKDRVRMSAADVFFAGPRKPQDPPPRPPAEKIASLLTVEQRQRWKDLIGDPYKGPAMPFRMPIGPPPPFPPPR